MATIQVLGVCAGGNHVTLDRDGVISVELADELLAVGKLDTAEGHALREHLAAIGVTTKEALAVEAVKGIIEVSKGVIEPGAAK